MPATKKRNTVGVGERDCHAIRGRAGDRRGSGRGRQGEFSRLLSNLGSDAGIRRLSGRQRGALDLARQRAVVDLRSYEPDRCISGQNQHYDANQAPGAACAPIIQWGYHCDCAPSTICWTRFSSATIDPCSSVSELGSYSPAPVRAWLLQIISLFARSRISTDALIEIRR